MDADKADSLAHRGGETPTLGLCDKRAASAPNTVLSDTLRGTKGNTHGGICLYHKLERNSIVDLAFVPLGVQCTVSAR